MIRVIKATDARSDVVYYLNCMNIVSIEGHPDRHTFIRTTADNTDGAAELLVKETAEELARRLDSALRNLGHSPS